MPRVSIAFFLNHFKMVSAPLLPGKSNGQKSLVGYSSWGHRSLTQLGQKFRMISLSPTQAIKHRIRDVIQLQSWCAN